MARDMVTRYGMTKAMGVMVYAENEGEVFLGRSVTKTTHISEKTMQAIDAEIRRLLEEQYNLARRLIEENRDKMEAMAQALLKWETIDADQIDDIMAGREPRPPKGAEQPAREPQEPVAQAAESQSEERTEPVQEMTQAPAEATESVDPAREEEPQVRDNDKNN
jgi:cell division protease FtsH